MCIKLFRDKEPHIDMLFIWYQNKCSTVHSSESNDSNVIIQSSSSSSLLQDSSEFVKSSESFVLLKI